MDECRLCVQQKAQLKVLTRTSCATLGLSGFLCEIIIPQYTLHFSDSVLISIHGKNEVMSIATGSLLTQLPLDSKFVALRQADSFPNTGQRLPWLYQGSREAKGLKDGCSTPFPLSLSTISTKKRWGHFSLS